MKEVTVDARDFIMAGGVISLETWIQLSDDDKQPFVIAGREKEQRFADDFMERLEAAFSEVGEQFRLSRVIKEAEQKVAP